MASLIDIKIPDIGEFHDVDVVEVMVKPGDRVNIDDSLITIESDKATMEVPSPQAGIVKSVNVKLGDKVSEGSAIVVIEAEGDSAAEDRAPAGPKAVEARPREVQSGKPPAAPANGARNPSPAKERPALTIVGSKADTSAPVTRSPGASRPAGFFSRGSVHTQIAPSCESFGAQIRP